MDGTLAEPPIRSTGPEGKLVRIAAGPRPLHGVLSLPEGRDAVPLVVVAHGFKGFMEWGFFPPLARLLRDRRFAVLRFDFSGAGMAPGDELVTDLAAFRSSTFSRDVEDLLAVAEHGPRLAPERILPGPVGVLGHSRGGGMAVLAASRPAGLERIGALVTWNAIGSVQRLMPAEVEQWRREGVYWIENARTGQKLPLGLELLRDIEENGEALDVHRAAALRRAPWLIVHGGDDETVPVEEAREMAARARPPVELAVLEGGGHTFGAVHPFRGPTPHLVEAMNRTQTWFRRWLGG